MTTLEIVATVTLSLIGLALILAGANACVELWRAIRKLTRPRDVTGHCVTCLWWIGGRCHYSTPWGTRDRDDWCSEWRPRP